MLQPQFHNESWSIVIKWSAPTNLSHIYQKKSKNDKPNQLFLVSSQLGSEPHNLIILGQTYNKSFRDLAHEPKFTEWRNTYQVNYQHNSLFVSHGAVTVRNGKLDQRRMDEIVFIINYIIFPYHFNNIQNVQSYYFTGGINGSYFIKNTGSGCMLPYKIMIGAFLDPGIKARRKNLWG